MPTSRMLILCPAGSYRSNLVKKFEDAGIAGERIEFISRVPPDEYFRLYHRVDICLDTIPYPGHTTTLDSLWMGVPVVTLTGQTAVSRGGLSILSNMGLAELIARTPEQYAKITCRLAADLPGLVKLRSTLRERLLASPLTDARQFAADMESAYRAMWKTWCAGEKP